MKILITGGGGFQGSHLAESLLAQGHKVTILNTYAEETPKNLSVIADKINLIWGSITDQETVEKSVRGHDVVFHLAAHINVDESLKDPLGFFQTNIFGTCNMLEAVRKHGSRLILASTCEVYGDGQNLKEGELISETAEMCPNSPYASSKAAADRIAYSYFRSHGLNITIARPFNVYGERQKSGLYGALIPILVGKALRGESLTVFGTGEATRDFSHVSDIVQGYNLILDNDQLKGKAINLASGTNIAVKDIAEYIAKKMNVPIIHGPARPGEVMRFPADISFARSFGYKPRVDIWEGIDRYIDWAKKTVKHKKLEQKIKAQVV